MGGSSRAGRLMNLILSNKAGTPAVGPGLREAPRRWSGRRRMREPFPSGAAMPKSPKKQPAKAAKSTVNIHDQKASRGAGGELHQAAAGPVPVMTTTQGGPVSDDLNSLKMGF